VRSFSAGLGQLGVSAGDRVTLYAETRAEWLVACQAAFSRYRTISASSMFFNA